MSSLPPATAGAPASDLTADVPDVERVEVHASGGGLNASGDGAPVRTLAFHLSDGRVVVVPADWYPRLGLATLDELAEVELLGSAVEWPLVNEIVPVRFLLEGVRGTEGADSLTEWRALMGRRRAQIAQGEEPEPHYPTLPLPDWWDEETDADLT